MAWLRLFSHGIHRIHRSFVALIRPRNSQNSQKLGCVSPPTDFTDLHRWLGCVCSPTDFTEFTEVRLHKSSHRFHGFAQMAWSRLFSHGIHGIHRSFVASVLPRNSQNSQKFGGAVGCVGMAGCHTLLHLCKSVLSVEATSLPEGSVHSVGSVGIQSPTDFTDLHRWLGCVCSSTEFTEFTEVLGCCWLRGYGRMPYPPNLCASVRICGRLFSARNFCAFRGFCGNIVSHRFHRSTQMVGCVNSPTEFTEFTEVWGCCWLRGYGRMPYPPNLCASVPICGRCFSARRFCVFRAFCGIYPCLFCWCSSCSDSR